MCQDTNQPPLRLVAGRLCGLLAAASAVGGRAAACLSGCRRGKEGGPAAGVMGCRGWLGGQWSGGNSAVFNQPLTTFLVVAMVWRLTVFLLCSYCLFWRWLGAIPVPWGLGGGGWSGGGLGMNCLPEPSREGVAEKGWGSS